MVPQPYRFSLRFLHRYGNLTILKFYLKLGEGYAAIHRGRGLPVVGGGGQSDDS